MKVTAYNTYYIIRYNSRLSDKLPRALFHLPFCFFFSQCENAKMRLRNDLMIRFMEHIRNSMIFSESIR